MDLDWSTWPPDLAAAVQAVADQEERTGGLPIRVEVQSLSGIRATIQPGWVHRRNYHRILLAPGIGGYHAIRHELEHLRLINAARKAGANRWYVVNDRNPRFTEVRKAIAKHLGRLPAPALEVMQEQVLTGLLTQLYNAPVDLLVEQRILAESEAWRPHVRAAVREDLDQGLIGLRAAAKRIPARIHDASAAMNGAMALWFGHTFGDLSTTEPFERMAGWEVAKQLYWDWSGRRWAPGEEYAWVDRWAALLGLEGWYGWLPDERPAA